jgi:hypothetical protein
MPDERLSTVTSGTRRGGVASLASLAILASVMLVACDRAPTTYTPDSAGVVVDVQQRSDGSYHLSLANGRSQDVETHAQKIVFGGAVPAVGDLMLAGSSPMPWVARVAFSAGCFWLGGGGTEDGDFVTMELGFRLRKATGFARGPYATDEHEFQGGGFCVNESGEVLAVK